MSEYVRNNSAVQLLLAGIQSYWLIIKLLQLSQIFDVPPDVLLHWPVHLQLHLRYHFTIIYLH